MTAELRIRAMITARRCVCCAERLGRCKSPICPGCATYWQWCERCQQPEPVTALCPPARCARPDCAHVLTDRRRRLCPECLLTWSYCPRCNQAKLHSDFAKNARQPSGLSAQCAVCDAARRDRKQPERPVIRNSERLANADRIGAQINRLLATGATWDEVAAEMQMGRSAVQQRWYLWCKRKQQEQQRCAS